MFKFYACQIINTEKPPWITELKNVDSLVTILRTFITLKKIIYRSRMLEYLYLKRAHLSNNFKQFYLNLIIIFIELRKTLPNKSLIKWYWPLYKGYPVIDLPVYYGISFDLRCLLPCPFQGSKTFINTALSKFDTIWTFFYYRISHSNEGNIMWLTFLCAV